MTDRITAVTQYRTIHACDARGIRYAGARNFV